MRTLRGRVVYDRPKHEFDLKDLNRIIGKFVLMSDKKWRTFKIEDLGIVYAQMMLLHFKILDAFILQGAITEAMNRVAQLLIMGERFWRRYFPGKIVPFGGGGASRGINKG